jgi:thiol:disulfide interchange protein
LDTFGGAGLSSGSELSLSGVFRVQQGTREGVLEVKAVLAAGWHTYALDQQGGPGPTKLSVKPNPQVAVTGAFQPNRTPQVRRTPEFKVPLREHYGEVVWSAPVRLSEAVDPQRVRLEVIFDGLLCHDSAGCKDAFGRRVEVAFGGYDAAAPSATPAAVGPGPDAYRAERSHATIRGHVEPGTAAPGGRFQLVLTAVPDPGWHIYAYEPRDPQQVAKPTLIVLTEPTGWRVGEPTASPQPTVKLSLTDEPPVRYHATAVTWTAEIQVPRDVAPGDLRVTGLVGYQTCRDTGCEAPTAAQFTVQLAVGNRLTDAQRPLTFTPARYAEAAKAAAAATPAIAPVPATTPPPGPGLDLTKLKTDRQEDRTLLAILGIALLGGFILNFMPCVLPVVGLKILSFVQQAGESRGRVFLLNLWYVLGLLSVFMVLATMVALYNEWAPQLSSEAFVVTMAAVVFTMGLSFLGVWEIPIPGFAGGAKATELADREGPLGAFAKGVITTVLATPCSGPGLATAIAWCGGKPTPLVYLVFTALGLGMAFPYLVLGANPRLVRFLPRPGPWMETFKQMMGFVLLGAVIFLLTTIAWTAVVPTVTLLFALWAACWWIGRTPITAEWQTRLRAWAAASGFAILVGAYALSMEFGFGAYSIYGLRGAMEYRFERIVEKRLEQTGGQAVAPAKSETGADRSELPWEPFSLEKLKKLTAQNKTVLVDFTADWCLTCKFLENTVLNTAEVRRAVEENAVVTLVADFTDRDPEIGSLLDALGSGRQVPVLAIFPAGQPNQPIVLMGGYTKGTLLEKLQQAGRSRG